MEAGPGCSSRLFKPGFISTSRLCPAALYLYNCLCGLFPSSATETCLYFMLRLSLFLLVFSPSSSRVCCPLPPLSANTPFLGFFKVFPSHARLYHQRGFPSSDVLSLCRWLLSVGAADTGGLLRRFWLRRFTERSLSPPGVAPTLGYLLLFLTVCPHEQNGGLLFLLL